MNPDKPNLLLGKHSLVSRAIKYTQAAVRHKLNGSPACTGKEIADRLAICKACSKYSPLSGQCSVCACYVNGNSAEQGRNKLAWADEQCPLDKWLALYPVNQEDTTVEK